MSDIIGQGQGTGTAVTNDSGNGTAPVGEGQGQPVETSTPATPDWVNNPFMEGVDEADRDIVGKYISKWDASVTLRDMERAQKYKPYEELGDVEELKKALEITNWIRTDPQSFVQALQRQVAPGNGNQQLQPNGNGQGLEEFPELQPVLQQFNTQFSTLQQRLAQQDQLLRGMAEYVQKQQQLEQQSQEDQQLKMYMDTLEQAFGQYDRNYVLALMAANGGDGVAAVKQWKQQVQQTINAQAAPPVGTPVLSGGGGAPAQQKKPEELSRDERKNLVMEVLAKSKELT